MNQAIESPLTTHQLAIVAIGASTAIGDIEALRAALNDGLSDGMTISTCREVLVQLYAYAGFPRSLNALSELISVLDARKAAGNEDVEGDAPSPLPSDYDALRVGTANQTQLIGVPVKGAVFDFAPAADQYVKAHVFGDIFSRDNLDWISREIATVGALASPKGLEAQLLAHVRISRNIGMTQAQLEQLPTVLEDQGYSDASERLLRAIEATAP